MLKKVVEAEAFVVGMCSHGLMSVVYFEAFPSSVCSRLFLLFWGLLCH